MEGDSMSVRTELLNRIQQYLSFLVAEVELEIHNNMVSTNMIAEEIVCGLLNRVFDYQLVFANQINTNSPAVDLVDQEHSIAVQVTVSNTVRKVQHTLEVFRKYRLYEEYRTLVIFVMSNRPIPRAVPKTEDFKLQIMNIPSLFKEITLCEAEVLREIADYLARELGISIKEPMVSDDRMPLPLPEPVVSTAKAASHDQILQLLCKTIGELPADSQSVLFFAALLPESGLKETLFKNALTTSQKRALTYLVANDWLLLKNEAVAVHPYIQEASLQLLRSSEEDYGEFLDQLWNFEKSFRWERVPLLEHRQIKQQLAQIYATAASVTNDPHGVFGQRSAELWMSANQIPDALRQQQKSIEFLKKSGENDPWALARAYHFVGDCYARLRHYKDALDSWQQTLRLCKNRLAVSPPDLAAAHYYVGCAFIELEEYQPAARHLELARSLHRKGLSVSHPFREEVQQKIDTAYSALGQHGISLNYLHSDLNREPEARYLWLPIPVGVGLPSFFGREPELAEIFSRLQSREKPVFITGLRGSGKTELALQFARNYQHGQVYFTRFDTTFAQTVARMAGGIRPALSQAELKKPAEEHCRLVLEIMRNCSANDVLIVDDVSANALSQSDPIYQQLLELDCRLILITEDAPEGSICVQPLPYNVLFDIFRKYDAQLDVSQMRALIDSVNGHTLTIDLIARTLGRKESNAVTPEQLLDSFSHNLPDDGGLRKVATDRVQNADHLKVIFRLASLSPSAKDVLRCAVLIPPQGIFVDLFRTALPERCGEALHELFDLGWLSKTDGIVSVHPAIQMICQEELTPTDQSCGAFLDALWERYSQDRYDASLYRQMAEVFSLAVQTLEDRKAEYIIRAEAIWYALGEYQSSKELLDTALPEYERKLPSDSPKLAQLYNTAGRTYSELGMVANALEYTTRALAICEKIYPSDHPELAASYSNVGSTYSALGNYQIAMDYQQKALMIRLNTLPSDHPDLAASYDSIGNTYSSLGDHMRALEYQKKALEIRERALPEYHPDIAGSYSAVGSSYTLLNNYQRALDYQQKALRLYERSLPPDHPEIAGACLGIGESLGHIGMYRPALEYHEKALVIYRKTLPDGHPVFTTIRNSIAMLKNQIQTDPTLPV